MVVNNFLIVFVLEKACSLRFAGGKKYSLFFGRIDPTGSYPTQCHQLRCPAERRLDLPGQITASNEKFKWDSDSSCFQRHVKDIVFSPFRSTRWRPVLPSLAQRDPALNRLSEKACNESRFLIQQLISRRNWTYWKHLPSFKPRNGTGRSCRGARQSYRVGQDCMPTELCT